MRKLLFCGLCSLLFAACVEVPGLAVLGEPAADGGPVAGDDGGAVAFDAGPAPIDVAPPTVSIRSPAAGATFATGISTVRIEGVATDDVGIAAVQVAVGPNAPVAAASSDFFRTWQVMAPLPAGTHRVRAIATDLTGKTAEVGIDVTRTPGGDTSAPVLTITSPADASRTTRAEVLVTGTATDDSGIAKVEAKVDGVSEYQAVSTSDTFATWRASVGLAPGVANVVRVRAFDLAGNSVIQTITVTSITAADREPPKLTIDAPADNASLTTASVDVTGTASDNVGLAKVELALEGGAFRTATTTDGFQHWALPVTLATGQNTIRVRATDASDLETVVTVRVTTTFRPEFDPPKIYELRLSAPRNRNVALSLDKAGMGEVIPESVRRSIKILDLDPTTLMTSTMNTIKDACGLGWQSPSFTPRCPNTWGQPELNLQRLLTMTPGNVNVEGTSIAGTKDIADTLSGFGLIDDFSTILANTLDISKTSDIVDTATAVAALKDDLIKTHPKANANGTLPVTIQDGFTDMRELATTFGPQGAHPGFLDPSTPTVSQVLLDTFRMNVNGTSNLTWYDGVDLSQGKDYIARLPSPTADVITFDFTNTLSVTGLAANPTVNLTFTMREHPQFLRAATRNNNQEPPAHPGEAEPWGVSKWLIEYVLIDASYRKYRARSPYQRLYELPFLGTDEAEIVVGANGEADDIFGDLRIPRLNNPRPGWARFWTLFGLGDPPRAQYLWDMIAEISQIRLRDGGVAEGQGGVRFQLANLPVGLTGAQIVAQMRPALEAQKSVLAQRLLGDYRANNGAVDFFLAGTAGNLFLFFSHTSDPLPRAVTYATPGFYADAALTQKVSATTAGTSGDAVHEKLALGAARTVYAKDDTGTVYRLELDAAASDRVSMRVSKKVR